MSGNATLEAITPFPDVISTLFPDVIMRSGLEMASIPTIVLLSSLFFLIGCVGILGNFLVIYAVLSDRRMRCSITNLLITNLAISDLVIMISCIPDIVQFMINNGWLLGLALCRSLRFIQVCALYTSVITLVSVCIERFVAIVHPIEAHIVCCRERIIVVIVFTWPIAAGIALPQIFFHVIEEISPNFTPCIMKFPSEGGHWAFEYAQSILFYLVPLLVQVTLYIRIGQRLFNTDIMEPVSGKKRFNSAINCRKGVVKMLIACVVVYFLCFSPHQVVLIYRNITGSDIADIWSTIIFTNIMAYASSASNPLLYSVFSHKFRRKLAHTMLCWMKTEPLSAKKNGCQILTMSNAVDRNGAVASGPMRKRMTFRFRSFRTTITEV